MPENPYIIPPYGSSGPRLHGWLLSALQEGEAWLRAQQPATEWQSIQDLLAVRDPVLGNLGNAQWSRTNYNKSKRIAREMVASLTNFRHEGEFVVEHNQELYDQASALTKLDQAWYENCGGYSRYREGMQYGVAFGTTYFSQEWDKHFHGPNLGDIRIEALAPDDVYFIQLPKNHDIQQAYAVIIRREMPINLARRIYSKTNASFAARLQPDRQAPGWIDKGLRKVQQLLGGSPVLNLGRDRRDKGAFPTVDIFHAYIMDDSINMQGTPVQMGAYGTNWSYTVPSYGSEIPTGVGGGTRTATEDDAALFPLRRLTIFSRSVDFPAYDGSSPWWHGQAPVTRVRFNDWPWEAMGASLIGDTKGLQAQIEGIMDDVEDSSHARLDPPMLYDDQQVNKAWADAINPRKSGVRAAANLQMGKTLEVLGEQWQYEVPQWVPEWIKAQEERMDYLTGTPDLIAVAKAKQVPSESTLEKLLEMAGPLVQDLIRNIEEPLRDLGNQRKSMYFQFYTVNRILRISGAFGKEAENFAFSPDLIVPNKADESQEHRTSRSRRYLHEFKYAITQSGVNEIHRLATKLFYLQLMKAGFPISWWTFAEIAQIPNFGPLPNDANGKPVQNEMEKWVAQKHIEAELQEELSQAAQGAIAPAPGGGNGAGPGGAAGPKGAPQGPSIGQPQQTGRPPVNTGAARIVQKDGGTRSTITTTEE